MFREHIKTFFLTRYLRILLLVLSFNGFYGKVISQGHLTPLVQNYNISGPTSVTIGSIVTYSVSPALPTGYYWGASGGYIDGTISLICPGKNWGYARGPFAGETVADL